MFIACKCSNNLCNFYLFLRYLHTSIASDGQVYWKGFQIDNGTAIVSSKIVKCVKFSLEVVSSQKTEIYLVELVFTHSAKTNKLRLRHNLNYCTCKRGAVTSDCCGHIQGSYRWLHHLRTKWTDKLSLVSQPVHYYNFHFLASSLRIPICIIDMSKTPLSVQSMGLIQNAAKNRKRKCQWGDVTEDQINDNTRKYINSAMKDSNQDDFRAICNNFLGRHKKGELDL